jgi:hypothetical protein
MQHLTPEEMARRRKETREWLIEQGETPGLEWYSMRERCDLAQEETTKFLQRYFND